MPLDAAHDQSQANVSRISVVNHWFISLKLSDVGRGASDGAVPTIR